VFGCPFLAMLNQLCHVLPFIILHTPTHSSARTLAANTLHPL
jgi:hypothetical protein